MAKLPGLTFFFPAYDEEEHVEAVVRSALVVLPPFTEELEVVVVDDGSRDRTGEIADALAAADPRVRVIHHRPNRGYGGAIRSGLSSARQPFVFYTDGDRQFDLADLGLLIDKLEGADAVIGYRIKRRDPPRRLLVASVYNKLIGLLFGVRWRDVDCAFKLFRTEVFDRTPLSRVRSNGAFFSPELLLVLRADGARIREVGAHHFPRTAGTEKGATSKVILRGIRDLLLLRLRLWGIGR